MKKILSLAAVLFFFLAANAEPVSQSRAFSIAKDFLAKRGMSLSQPQAALRAPRAGAADAYYYVFNADSNHGYVIVSGDDRTEQILGYSDEGYIDTDNMPENLRSWLQFYADQIKWIDDNNIQTAPETPAARAQRRASKAHHSIAPILTCNWNQGDPYNRQCPDYYENGSIAGRSATGCVATAIAQVLYFHKFPEKTRISIPSLNGGTSFTNLPAIRRGSVIDWANMCDNYYGSETDEQKDAVAFLMVLVGQALKMGYGASSGSSYAESRKLFVDYLGYDDGVQILRSDNYGIQEWFEMMYDELDRGYPIAYGGTSSGGGHAFVVDGFDGDDLFHLNWGWGGASNGYFRITVLNPGDNSGIGASSSADGYSMGQDAILYLRAEDDGVPGADSKHLSINETRIEGTKIISNYVNWSGQNGSFNAAIVMKNEDGVLEALTPVQTFTLNINTYTGGTFDVKNSFPAPGSYRITPASKLAAAQIWQPLYNLRDEYIRADVDENLNVTLTKVNPDCQLEVTNWSFPGTLKAGDQQDVTIRLKNNGEEFKRELALYASKTDNMGSSVSRALIGVKSGDEDEFAFYFKPNETGTWNIWLTLLSDRSKIVGQTTVDIKNVAQNSLNLSVESVTMQAGGYGDFLMGTMTVKNNSSKDFAGFVKMGIWHLDGAWWSGSSQQLYYEIPARQTGTASFRFDNLRIGDTYRFNQTYTTQSGELGNGGVFAGSEWTLKAGAISWTKYGTASGGANNNFRASANGAGTWFCQFVPTSITPSANASYIYQFDEDAAAPESLAGKNVVIGNEAEEININSTDAVYFPKSFTAKRATLSHTFTRACDGLKGFDVVTLPFAAESVTIDGEDIDPAKVFIKEFAEENDQNEVVFGDVTLYRGGTPYIIGASEELVGKTITFYAENAAFKATNTDFMYIGSEHFGFNGAYYNPRLTDVYVLNADGSAFDLYTGAATGNVVTGGYFTTKFSVERRPESIAIQYPGQASGIETLRPAQAEHAIYDLQGRRVSQPQKGLYIVNGKKIIIN